MIDFMEMYNRRNQELAIRGAVKYRLEEILPLLGKNRLTDIATSIGLPGRSSMKKAELAARLHEVLLKEYRLDATLLLAREEEFQFLQEVLSEPCLQVSDITPGTYLHFLDHGVLFTFWQQDKLYLVIPEEVKEALRQLDWDALLLTRAREQVVLQYVNAAVNLYGVCTPELILEIYNDQNDQSLRLQDLEEITDFHLKRVQFYERMDGYYVSQYFDESTVQEMQALLKRIQNKPRYIPSKEKFLMYSDDHYSEMTPQLLQLRLFILNQLCEDAELVDSAIDDIQIACSMEEPLQTIVNELDRRGITFDNINQVKRFSSLVTEVYNHTRLWSNCGHTPAELGALTGGTAIRAIPGQRVVAAKVGRNDPCPCGSGKKYKKCCGEQ